MPRRRQPATLLSLCHHHVASHLVSTCRLLQVSVQESPATQVLSLAKRYLRPHYLAILPAPVRTEVLERASRLLASTTTSDGPGAGSASLYLLALLLAPDIKQLRVELCCYYGCTHQTALLRLLAAEGSGLQDLELARSALLRLDRGLLTSALSSATGLRRLVLRNIAADATLQVIGACCPVLEVLDVAHSRQVTDQGLRSLLVNVELTDKEEASRASNQGLSWSRLKILSRIMPWLRRETSSGKRRVLLQYCERKNELCETLQTLDVANTGVTSGGIILALHRAIKLQSLGDFGHTGRALEVMERVNQPVTSENKFPLVEARCSNTTPRRLELMTRCLPSLHKLVLVEPRLSPASLQLLPGQLTVLALHGVSPEHAVLPALASYLRQHGASLAELTLRFANPGSTHEHALPELDLPQVLAPCPRLRSLTVDNARVDWLDSEWSNEHVLPCLQTAQLGRVTHARVLGALLSRAPKLRVLHLHSCQDLTDVHLAQVARHSQKLQCFYVYEARKVTSAPAVCSLISSCTKLRHLGHLTNWGLDCEGSRAVSNFARHLELELHTGAHWFTSACVK